MKISSRARLKIAREVFALASKIAKRDGWFIGGFLGDVQEEWELVNAKAHRPFHSVETKKR